MCVIQCIAQYALLKVETTTSTDKGGLDLIPSLFSDATKVRGYPLCVCTSN